jgi:hypothetical protein
MKITLFYVTYEGSHWLFKHSIDTVRRRLNGHCDIVGVAPIQDSELYEQYTDVKWHFIPDWPGQGYFWQQWVKMMAPSLVDRDTTHIFHMDSDCMVLEDLNVQEFVGLWPYIPYSDIIGLTPWQKPTELALLVPVDNEYMRAFPFCIEMRTYAAAQEAILKNHKASLEDYIRSQTVFSEFNVLGAVANSDHPECYNWLNQNEAQLPSQYKKVRQFLSSESEASINKELKTILK